MGYPQEDFGITRPQGIVVPELNKSYPSPTSTVSGQNESTHGLDSTVTSVSVSSTVPISRTSELAFALQSQPEKVITLRSYQTSQEPDELTFLKSQSSNAQDNNQSYLAFGTEQNAQRGSGDLSAQGSELLFQAGSDGDVPQGSFNPNFSLSDVYSSDSQMNQALYHVYNDISPLDTGSNHSVEVFAGYS